MTRTTLSDRPGTATWPGRPALLPALLVLLLAGPGVGAAQDTGRISGHVLDEETGRPLAQAQVFLDGTGIGSLTDLDGRYTLREVPTGIHHLVVRIIGYQMKTVTGVEVRPGATVELSIALPSQAVAVEELSVSVAAALGSAARLLETQRRSQAVQDAIGRQDISRSPASDAAEAAKRMTGVTVQEGRYVFVRGLGERYSSTALNGASLPSPEPDKEAVPLDLFSANMLQSITVQKTYTADQPADFSGGLVRIDTQEFPDQFTFEAGFSTGMNEQVQLADQPFLKFPGREMGVLGGVPADRGLPEIVERELGGMRGTRLPTSDRELVERVGEAFPRAFAPVATNEPPPGLSAKAEIGNQTELLGRDFGYLFNLNYSNDYSFRPDEVERKYRSTSFTESLPAPNVDYTFRRATREIAWGGLANLNMLLSKSDKLGLKALATRNSEAEARTFFGANREDIGAEVRNERTTLVMRDLVWGQLYGEHETLWGSRLEWRATAARAGRDEPGLRETLYSRSLSARDGDPFTLDNTGPSARYLYTELTDDELNGSVDWRFPFRLGAGEAAVKVGGGYRLKERDFAARRFRFQFFPGVVTSADSALSDASIVGFLREAGQFALSETVEPGDRYTASDRRLAGYAMLEMPLVEGLTATGGARLEDYDLDLNTQAESSGFSELGVFPSLNLRYALSEAMNLRAGGSLTTNRPQFRELAPFQFTEAASLRQIFGNPELEPSDIVSADLRWEWFPATGEIVSLSAFYKWLDQPIEQVFIATASSGYSYQNADEGRLFGAEAEVRKGLGFLSPTLRSFHAQINGTVVDSEVEVSQQGSFDPTNPTRALEGQAPWVVNAALVFAPVEGATEAGLFYNVAGERIIAAGGAGVPDIEEQPRHAVGATLTQRLPWNLRVKAEAENLLDEPHLFHQSANGVTRIQRRYETGVSFSLGLTYQH